MRDVKKVLEMRSQNHSQRKIATSLKISRDTVRKIFNAADSKKFVGHLSKIYMNQMSKSYCSKRNRALIW